MRDSLLHDACAFDDLRKEHLSGSEEVTDDSHAVHQGTFNHVERGWESQPRLLRIVHHELHDAFDQGVREALANGFGAPLLDLDGFGGTRTDFRFGLLRVVQQLFRGKGLG